MAVGGGAWSLCTPTDATVRVRPGCLQHCFRGRPVAQGLPGATPAPRAPAGGRDAPVELRRGRRARVRSGSCPIRRAGWLRLGQPDRNRSIRCRPLGAGGRVARASAQGDAHDRHRLHPPLPLPRCTEHNRAHPRIPTAPQPARHRMDRGNGRCDAPTRPGKATTGAALGNQVLLTEGRITFIDAILASAVLSGLLLNSLLGWWWADPAAGYVLLYYSVREARASFARLIPSFRCLHGAARRTVV